MNPTTSPRRPRTACFAAALLTATLMAGTLSACSTDTPTADTSCTAPDALVIIAGAHANASPGLPKESTCLIKGALDANAPISLVIDDGQPYSEMSRRRFGVNPNADTYKYDYDAALSTLIKTVPAAKARTNGTDPLSAFILASDLLAGAQHPAIIALTPGLSDQKPLDLTDPQMATIDPAENTTYLKSIGALPPLEGTEILWAGNTEAHGEQPPLTPGQKENYRAIWESLLTTSGATTTFVASGPATTPKSEGHTVKAVPPTTYDNRPKTNTTKDNTKNSEVYSNASELGFEPRTSVFRDRPAAITVAKEIAASFTSDLADDPTLKIVITGTTATADTVEARKALSKERASVFKDLLIEEGLSSKHIETIGAGTDFKEFIPDTRNGVLIPALAEKNRTIRIDYTHSN